MKSIKLKWRIFAFLLIFCALLLGILWLLQTVFLNDMYKYIRRNELKQAIAEVERELENPNLESILKRIEREKDITVTLTMNYSPPFYMRRVTHSDYITEVKEFELDNGYVLSLTFHAMIAPVNATVSTIRMQLYIITLAMILLAVLLAFIIAKRVSEPIEALNKKAAKLATGDYGVRFNGKGFHEIVVLSDTLNTAAEELGRVEELRRELLANVSHDLRTPLTLIYTYAEMMSDFPDEITDNQLKVIMGETRRLTSLVNDVLDISKIENTPDSLNKTSFNLTESISRIAVRIQALLENDGYKINFRYDAEVFVNADEPKIGRAFYNLLINAVNYAGEDKTVTVTQSVNGNRVRITVADNGEGISPKDLPYIWDRYYKSGKTHKRAVMGTGLGLSIVKKIMDLHGADYGVNSKEGQGSEFYFELRIEN